MPLQILRSKTCQLTFVCFTFYQKERCNCKKLLFLRGFLYHTEFPYRTLSEATVARNTEFRPFSMMSLTVRSWITLAADTLKIDHLVRSRKGVTLAWWFYKNIIPLGIKKFFNQINGRTSLKWEGLRCVGFLFIIMCLNLVRIILFHIHQMGGRLVCISDKRNREIYKEELWRVGGINCRETALTGGYYVALTEE